MAGLIAGTSPAGVPAVAEGILSHTSGPDPDSSGTSSTSGRRFYRRGCSRRHVLKTSSCIEQIVSRLTSRARPACWHAAVGGGSFVPSPVPDGGMSRRSPSPRRRRSYRRIVARNMVPAGSGWPAGLGHSYRLTACPPRPGPVRRSGFAQTAAAGWRLPVRRGGIFRSASPSRQLGGSERTVACARVGTAACPSAAPATVRQTSSGRTSRGPACASSCTAVAPESPPPASAGSPTT